MSVVSQDTRQIAVDQIRPAGGLFDSAPELDDRTTLDRRFKEEGYLYFRGMILREAAEAARLRMAQVLVEQGLIPDTDRDARWIGGDRPSLHDESPLFAGICRGIFEWPGVAQRFEKLLGEPIAMIPNVLYRAYKPHHIPGPVHQDGAFNPGVVGYRTLWIALDDIEEEAGGLVIAHGYHHRGPLHEEHSSLIPPGTISSDSWRRGNYRQGDVVVVHPFTPHAGLPNRSGRVRYSVDTRIQSAAHPTVLDGVLTAVDTRSVTLKCDDGQLRAFTLDDDTVIRYGNGALLTREELVAQIPPGCRTMVIRDGDKALMLRHAHAG